MLVGNGNSRIAGKRRTAGQQLKQDNAGGVQVGTRVHLLTASLLGRQVLGSANDSVRLRHRRLRIGDRTRDTEVHDLHLAVIRQHDVARLDIPVHQMLRMGVFKRAQHAGHDGNGLVDRHRSTVSEQFLDRVPLNVLHHDVRHGDSATVRAGQHFLARVVHGHNIRVVQRSSRLRFTPETRLEHGVSCQVRAQHLDCDNA